MRGKTFILLCAMLLALTPISAAVDAEPAELRDMLLGTDSGWSETSLGDATADAVAFGAGTQTAIVPAEAITGNLRGGPVTRDEVCHAVDGSMRLARADVTASQLYELLEDGLSSLTLNEQERLDIEASASDRFPQISGFTMRVDASAPAGERVMELCLSDGQNVGRDSTLSISLCSSAAWLDAHAIENTPLESDQTPGALLFAYIQARLLQEPVKTGRIRLLGTLDDNFMNGFSPLAIAVVMAIIVLFSIAYVRQNGRPASRRYGTR